MKRPRLVRSSDTKFAAVIVQMALRFSIFNRTLIRSLTGLFQIWVTSK